MLMEIWRTEAIENILWATQTVIQATTLISGDDIRSVDYHDGFRHGFEAGLDQVIVTFKLKPFSLKIWSDEHIRNVVQSVQTKMQLMANSMGQARSRDYQQGFYQGLDSALWCIATSFGMSLESLKSNPQSKKINLRLPTHSYGFGTTYKIFYRPSGRPCKQGLLSREE